MAINEAPELQRKFTDRDGTPLGRGKVFTYIAGSDTRIDTYQDKLGTFNKNPIVLDADGSCEILLDDSIAYRFEVFDKNGRYIKTKNNVTSIGFNSGTNRTLQNVGIASNTLEESTYTLKTGIDVTFKDSLGDDLFKMVESSKGAFFGGGITTIGGLDIATSSTSGQTFNTFGSDGDSANTGELIETLNGNSTVFPRNGASYGVLVENTNPLAGFYGQWVNGAFGVGLQVNHTGSQYGIASDSTGLYSGYFTGGSVKSGYFDNGLETGTGTTELYNIVANGGANASIYAQNGIDSDGEISATEFIESGVQLQNKYAKINGDLAEAFQALSLTVATGISAPSFSATGDISANTFTEAGTLLSDKYAVINGSATEDFSVLNLNADGGINYDGALVGSDLNTFPNFVRRDSANNAFYVDQRGTGSLFQGRVWTGASYVTRVSIDNMGDIVTAGDISAVDGDFSGVLEFSGTTTLASTPNNSFFRNSARDNKLSYKGVSGDEIVIEDATIQNYCYLDWNGTTTSFNHGTQNVWSVINFWTSTESNNITYNGSTGDDAGSYTFDVSEFDKYYRAILNLSLAASSGSHTLELAIESKLDAELWPENDGGAVGDNIVAGSTKTVSLNATGGSFTQVTKANIPEKEQIRVIWRCTDGSNKTTNISYGIKEITKVST